MSEVGKRLIAASREVAAIARGEAKPAGCHVPPDVDVRAIRTALKLSQDDFSLEFGFTLNQIRDWEQGRSKPTGAVRAYLVIIMREPEAIRSLLRKVSTAARRKAA